MNAFSFLPPHKISLQNENRGRLLWQIAGKDDWRSLEEVENLDFALRRLTKETRMMVEMRIEGYSYKQISEIFKCKEKAVRTRMDRAKKVILQVFTEYL